MKRPIASRVLKLKGQPNGEGRLIAEIFSPTRIKDQRYGKGSMCEYRVVFPDKIKEHVAYGVDSFQALCAAIDFAKISVLTSQYAKDGLIDWEGDEFRLIVGDAIVPPLQE